MSEERPKAAKNNNFAAKVEEVKEGGDGCLTVCAS
jgi:hypothetical protein